MVLDITLFIMSIDYFWTLYFDIEILDLCYFICNRFEFRFSCNKFKDVTGLIFRLSGFVYGII